MWQDIFYSANIQYTPLLFIFIVKFSFNLNTNSKSILCPDPIPMILPVTGSSRYRSPRMSRDFVTGDLVRIPQIVQVPFFTYYHRHVKVTAQGQSLPA